MGSNPGVDIILTQDSLLMAAGVVKNGFGAQFEKES